MLRTRTTRESVSVNSIDSNCRASITFVQWPHIFLYTHHNKDAIHRALVPLMDPQKTTSITLVSAFPCLQCSASFLLTLVHYTHPFFQSITATVHSQSRPPLSLSCTYPSTSLGGFQWITFRPFGESRLMAKAILVKPTLRRSGCVKNEMIFTQTVSAVQSSYLSQIQCLMFCFSHRHTLCPCCRAQWPLFDANRLHHHTYDQQNISVWSALVPFMEIS